MGPIAITAAGGATFGLLSGSFLNVCISRLPAGRSIVSPRSHCECCGRQIRWYDNIPVVSYLFLRGRCRDCRSRIGLRHLLVELLTGLWFALGALPLSSAGAMWSDAFFRLWIHQVGFCALGFFLIALLVIDWQWQRLPDTLTMPGMALGLLLVCTDAMFLGERDYNLILQRKVNLNAAGSGHSTGNVFLTGPEHLICGRLAAVICCFLLLFVVRVAYRAIRKREGMGMGDAKLFAMIAAFTGLAPALLSLFVGTLLATVYGVVLLTRGSATAASRLPFGSFLAAGGLLAGLPGAPLMDWYLGLFR